MEDKIGSPKMDDKKFQALNQKASFEKAKTKRIKDLITIEEALKGRR